MGLLGWLYGMLKASSLKLVFLAEPIIQAATPGVHRTGEAQGWGPDGLVLIFWILEATMMFSNFVEKTWFPMKTGSRVC